MKTVNINAIKLNFFQWKAKKALDGSTRVMPWWDDKNVCHWQVIDTIRHYNHSLTKEIATDTGKNKKLRRKVREESVEAI